MDSHGSAITGGEHSPPGLEDAVLLLQATRAPAQPVCTASLVAPNLVLTARHCVAALVPGVFGCSGDGELLDQGTGAGTFDREYPADSLAFYAGRVPRDEPVAFGQQIFSTQPVDICTNDIAVVLLDRALELPILPLRRRPRAEIGERITVIGYGPDGGERLELETQPRRRITRVPIAEVGPDSIQDGARTVAPRTFVTLGPFACRGDSGGPAVSERDGGLLGLFSTQRGTSCLEDSVENIFVHV
ncbi:MAG TPA: trypsin-like serine protease, partial [Polyangiaceae bacterium]